MKPLLALCKYSPEPPSSFSTKYETGAQEKLSILPKNTQQPMESQNWVTAVTDSEAPHLPRALGTNVNTGTCTLQTFKDVNMHLIPARYQDLSHQHQA